ncbi:hypothetical protein BSG1_20990 [Bacillus sp. SG-1]|nr:hypothetical protein BSG1_20990 [Bacillus sp. SG-1]
MEEHSENGKKIPFFAECPLFLVEKYSIMKKMHVEF